jgi:FAD dependent oxidoreductase TIGR03364
MTRWDVAIVGGGIVGLAFARAAARRGRRVVLVDRTARPEGASVRNFGMIWPIGQRPGADYARAIRSRELWQAVAAETGIWFAECGSLHAVHHDDEMAVLHEFAKANGAACELLSPAETRSRCPAIRPDGLKGGLFSPTECAVNPRTAIAAIARHGQATGQFEIRRPATVAHVEPGRLTTAGGETIDAETILVCSGSDFETLFPSWFAASGIRKCKLQMMHTGPQPGGFRLGPHVAGGLTLTHYKSFEACPSLPAVTARYARDLPQAVRLGIHVMASQQDTGEITIGDSHEYDDAISPFESEEIDGIILNYLDGFLQLPDRRITARWSGIYAKHPSKLFVAGELAPGVHACVAPGGAGMTLAFALAEEWWEHR